MVVLVGMVPGDEKAGKWREAGQSLPDKCVMLGASAYIWCK